MADNLVWTADWVRQSHPKPKCNHIIKGELESCRSSSGDCRIGIREEVWKTCTECQRHRWTFRLVLMALLIALVVGILSCFTFLGDHRYRYYIKRESQLDETVQSVVGRGAACECWQVGTNGGGTPALYTNFVLQDYRPYKPDGGPPPLVAIDTGLSQVTAEFFAMTAFDKDFQLSDYSHPSSGDHPVLDSFSKGNVYLAQDNSSSPGYITLRTNRQVDFQTSAEVSSNFKFMYGSARMLARIGGAPGAVASTFFYANDQCETDMEIITNQDTSTFHATNQPSQVNGNEVPGATRAVNIAPPLNASWQDWNVWGIDWTASGVVWTFNGQAINTNTVNIPDEPMSFLMNVWSDGGSWSGEMAVGATAWMDIQYFHLAYNASTSGTCPVPACAVPAI